MVLRPSTESSIRTVLPCFGFWLTRRATVTVRLAGSTLKAFEVPDWFTRWSATIRHLLDGVLPLAHRRRWSWPPVMRHCTHRSPLLPDRVVALVWVKSNR